MELQNFQPRSKLFTKTTRVAKPRFPVIDAHNHLGEEYGGGWENKPLPQLLDLLDQSGVYRYVDLDGGWGEEMINSHLDHFKNPAPDRFMISGGVEWSHWKEKGNAFPEWAAKQLRAQKERGVECVKVWKNFGLHVRDQNDNLVDVDDQRLAPIWETAGELGLPFYIHFADPPAFFDPIDETNERWEELGAHPEWAFTSPPFPPFMHIMEAMANLVTQYPKTTFVGAHVGNYAENLDWLGTLLDRCPNFFIDISARVGDLGRQPYSARRFFIKYADRIMFGCDYGPYPEAYQIIFRSLETDDEYFNYSVGPTPMQGRWYIYGLYLPDDVLEKVYFRNAERILCKKG